MTTPVETYEFSIDDGEPVTLRSMSVKADTYHKYFPPSGAPTLHPVNYIIEVELAWPPGPVLGLDGNKHNLRVRQAGLLVHEYEAYLVSTIQGFSDKSVQMKWHTVNYGSAWVHYDTPSDSDPYADSGELLAKVLPDLTAQKVQLPCDCGDAGAGMNLQHNITHLNDTHKWTREQIADWLDTLDLDLTFPVPDTIPSDVH